MTDIEDYKKTIENVIIEERENIDKFRKIFNPVLINSFRAPGFSFTPPHLEGIREIGLIYDFSTLAFKRPTLYKGITFYPNSRGALFIIEKNIMRKIKFFLILLLDILLKNPVILQWHPFDFVLKGQWLKREGDKISFSYTLLPKEEIR